jgi:GNAT superfamily N-acetyltransferase
LASEPKQQGGTLVADHALPPLTGRLEILEAGDLHAAAVAEFIREVWTPSATASSVLASRSKAAASNAAEPGVAPPTWIALRAGRVLGYVTTIPVRFWDGERALAGYWIKGLMVLPEFQNGPIGYAVMKAAAARLPRSGGLAVASQARRLFVALGYTDLGPIPNWILPLAPGALLSRLDLEAIGLTGMPRWLPPSVRLARATGLATVAGWAGGWALRGLAAVSRMPGAGLQATGPTAPPAVRELDALWESAQPGFPSGVIRDGSYLLERYPVSVSSPYEWVLVRRRGALAGAAILRRPRTDGDPRLRGIRVATLVDLLFPPADRAAGLALLGAVEGAGRRMGAEAMLATSSARLLAPLLRRQCFVRLPGNVHLLFRDASGEETQLARSLPDWWLTRGDGTSDEVF